MSERFTEKEVNACGIETGFYSVKKAESNIYVYDNLNNPRNLSPMFWAKQKLGHIEDIEDKLGIDLFILFKALTEGVWVRLYGEMAIHIDKPISLRGIDRPGEVYHFSLMYEASCNTYQELPLREYGRIWALTKEELE